MNNLLQKSSEALNIVRVVETPTRISARELHKYVVGLVGVFMLFVVTYSIAVHRVERQAKFAKERSGHNLPTVVFTSIESQPRK